MDLTRETMDSVFKVTLPKSTIIESTCEDYVFLETGILTNTNKRLKKILLTKSGILLVAPEKQFKEEFLERGKCTLEIKNAYVDKHSFNLNFISVIFENTLQINSQILSPYKFKAMWNMLNMGGSASFYCQKKLVKTNY